MDPIVFIRRWSKNRETTWSGTPSGILTSLKKLCGNDNIIEVPIEYNLIRQIELQLLHAFQKLFFIDGCEVLESYIDGKIADKKMALLRNSPIIVFSECKTRKVKDTYVYIDCSVDFAYQCQQKHEAYSQYVPFSKKRKYSMLNIRNKMAQRFYIECKGVFTMGNWLACDLIENTGLPNAKVHCVGGGCNIPISFIENGKKEGNKFLFVGKDFNRKNGPLVVEAFEILNNKYKGKFKLYIAGPTEYPLSRSMPYGVTFLGLRTTVELSKYYNLCDVFVMPSQFEAYGIVFAEALIYGLPCIGRDAFSMRDFIQDGENGYLLKHQSADELASLMEKSILNSAMRQRVINDRRKYIEKYSWKTVAKRIVNVMKEDGYDVL